jgi:predicted membrane channel-forming protein YqfA (hemolysin III family)
MCSPNDAKSPQIQSLNPIIIISLILGSFITIIFWLDVSAQLIVLLFWLSLGAAGLSALLLLRSNSANPFWFRALVILAAVSLVYLFPELFRPICGSIPRAFASPSSKKCGRCVNRVCEWNYKKHQ